MGGAFASLFHGAEVEFTCDGDNDVGQVIIEPLFVDERLEAGSNADHRL